jgi:hypothetical protein
LLASKEMEKQLISVKTDSHDGCGELFIDADI